MNKEQLEILKKRLDQFEMVYQCKKIKLQDQLESISYEESLKNEFLEKIQAYKTVLHEMNKELSRNKRVINSLKAENDDLDSRLIKLIKDRKNTNIQLEEISERIKKAKECYFINQQRYQKEASQLKIQEEEHKKELSKLHAFKNALLKNRELSSSLEEKNNNLKQITAQVKNKINEYQNENHKTEQVLIQLKNKNKKLVNEYKFIKNKESLLKQSWLKMRKQANFLLKKNNQLIDSSQTLAQSYLDLRLDMEEIEKKSIRNMKSSSPAIIDQ